MDEGNIVKVFMSGNTKIKIADDYCVNTAAEIEAIRKNISDIAVRHTLAAQTNKVMRWAGKKTTHYALG